MAYRFIKERDYTNRFYNVIDKGSINIVTYSRIKIIVTTPTNELNLSLSNVYYILKLMTNMVLESYLEVKDNIYRDSRNRRLERNSETIFLYIRDGGYYLLEDNTNGYSDIVPSLFATTRAGTVRVQPRVAHGIMIDKNLKAKELYIVGTKEDSFN